MNIIGIAGLAGSGKSTVARLLVEKHGFVEVALADAVKRVAQQLYGFTDNQLWGPSEMRNALDLRFPREHGPCLDGRCVCCNAQFHWDGLPQCYLTPRHTLQQIGTEFGRAAYPSTWVDIALRVAKDVLEHSYGYNRSTGLDRTALMRCAGVVISDVRFENELAAIKAAGGAVWRVDRPGAGLAGAAGQHVSETALRGVPDESFDVVLENTGTLEHLELLLARTFAEARGLAQSKEAPPKQTVAPVPGGPPYPCQHTPHPCKNRTTCGCACRGCDL